MPSRWFYPVNAQFEGGGVRPAHHPLQVVVQTRKRRPIRHQHAAPDHRRGIEELDAQGDGLRPRWHGWRLAAPSGRRQRRPFIEDAEIPVVDE
jgi:hypothetical protein